MKIKSTNRFLDVLRRFSTTTAIVISFIGAAQAANENRYWDGGTANAANPGNAASAGGAGNWNTTLTNWDLDPSGSNHVAWVNANNDFAVFGGTAGTVTLTSAVSANKLTFNTTGYIVAGNTLTLSGPSPEIAAGTGISASISSIIAGTTGLNKTGVGTLTINNITAANTYSGGTTITGGILSIGTGGTAANTARTDALGGGAVAVNGGTLKLWIKNDAAFTIANNLTVNGGTLLNQDGNHTLSGTVAVGASGATLQAVFSGKNLALSGVVSGSGPVTVNGGGGTVVLSNAANTYTGTYSVTGGILQIAAAGNLGTSAASLSFPTAGAGLTITGTAVTLANNVSLGAVSGNINLDTPNSSSTVFNGTISGGGASTVWFLRGGAAGQNSGAITLNGTNTGLLGTLNVQRGPLVLGNANAAGSTSIILDSNNNPNGALQLAGSFTIANNIRIDTPAQKIGVGTGLSAGISGVISTQAAEFNGIDKVGAGTLTLFANNTLTGPTVVTAGTLALDYTTNNGSKLDDLSALTMSGGKLDLVGTNVTPHVELVGSTSVSANSNLTRTGATANQIALGAITSTGGTLNLTADSIATTSNALANGLLPSYITVNGGPATTNGSSEIIAASGIVDIFRLGGQVTSGAGTNVRIIEGGTTGDVTMLASGTTDIATLTNAGTAAPTTVDIGSGRILRLGTAGAVSAGSNGLTFTNGTLTAGGAADSAGVIDFFNSSAIASAISSVITDNGLGAVALTKGGSGVLVLGGVNSYTGTTTVNAGTLALTGAAVLDSGAVSIANTAGTTLRLDASETIGSLASGASSSVNLQANALTLGSGTLDGVVSGTGGSMIKTGAGTLTLNGANTYTGGTTVGDGTLTARVTAGQNALGTGVVAVTSGKTLNLNNVNTASDTTIANVFSGAGNLNVLFANSTTGRNTRINTAGSLTGFSGALRLSLPTGTTGDKLSDLAGIIPGSLTIDSGTQLYASSASGVSFTGGITVSGTGNTEARGAIRLGNLLGGDITLAGDTTIGAEGGTATGNITSAAAVPVTLTVGTTNSAGNSTFGGVISNGAFSTVAVTKATGTGIMTLAGTNTYSGATTLTLGTLNLTGSAANSALTMAATTTLTGEGTIGSLTTSGASNLVINPGTEPGALTSTGALSLGGVVTVSFAGASPTAGTFRVLNYTGADPLATSFALANSASYRTPTFTPGSGKVDLTVGVSNLTWTAAGGSNWDVNTTSNWNDTTPAASKFFFGDSVTFSDANISANQTVGLTVNVQPANITFTNSTYSYALAGAGNITGTTGITKNGTNVVTLGGANGQNFTGAIAVNAGTLAMGSRDAFGLSSGITIASGASVNINDQTPGTVTTGGYTYSIKGTGVSNAGAIHNTTAVPGNVASNAGVKTLNLTDNASIGGTSRFDIGFANTAGTGGINGNGFTLTKIGANQIDARGPATNVNYVVSEGTLGFETTAAASGTNPITVNGTGKVVVVGALTIPNNVTLATGTTLGSLTTANGNWSGSLSLATGSTIDTPVDLFVSGTATTAAGGTLAKTGAGQLIITGALTGSGGTLNHNAGTIQIGNVAAAGSISGFTTVNLANGVLFRSRLSGANNSISSNFTFANASSELRQHAGTAADTLSLTGTIGSSTATGILRVTFGKLVLESGASSSVNFVGAQGDPATGRGVIEVKTGASLTSPWFNIGQDGGQAGILNVTGGTVTALYGGTNGTTGTSARIGHWNSNSATVPSELNVVGGTFDASAPNVTTSIGWDGYGIMTVGGGANPALAKVYGIQLDANGDSPTYNDTVTLLPNGTLEVGTGGTASASANDYFILNGGTIKGVTTSTWAARMDVTAATTSFVSVNSGIAVTQTGTLTGTGTLRKTGPGLLQATGGAFAGTLTSSGGTLHFGTTAWTAATVASSAGGVIQPGTPATAGTVNIPTLTLNGGSPTFRANYNNGNYGDRFVVTGSDAFTVATPTVLTVIPGSDLFVGDKIPIIDYSGAIGGTSGFAGLTATAAGNPHYQLGLENDTANTVVNVVIDALDSVIWKGNVNGNWDLTTSNWETVSNTTTSKFYDLDAVKFTDDGSGAPVVTLTGTIKPSSVQFDASVNYTLQGDPITGSTGLLKGNTGSVTLLNNNINTGPVVINDGTVTVGNGGTTGALGGTGDITIGATATLEINRSDAQTLSRKLTGGGKLVKNGSGNLTTSTSGNNADITINGGTFFARGGGFSAGFDADKTITINSPAVLDTAVHSMGSAVGGGGNVPVVVLNGGNWILNGEQYMQFLTMTAGTTTRVGVLDGIRTLGGSVFTINAAATSSVIDSPFNLVNSVNVVVNDGAAAADLLVSGNVSNVGILTKSGAGKMVLSGTNTYTGGTALNGGTLEASSIADAGGVGSIGTYTSLGAGYLGIANDATFRYTGTAAETTARYLWIDTGVETKTIEVTSATGSINFNSTGGNINKPFTKTGPGALTIVDEIQAGATVTVDGGTLTLSGTNTYTGDTTVNAGILAVNGSSIADGGNLVIGTGKVNVTGTETVNTLFFGATQQASGTWGATGSGAAHIDDAHFTGTGVVNVTTAPATGYSTWAATHAGGGTPTQDYDGDGVSNGLEWVLGGLETTNDLGKLPAVSTSGGNLVFTFVRSQQSKVAGTSVAIEVGTALTGWPAIYNVGYTTGSSSVGVSVTDNLNGTDTVTLLVTQAPDATKFARLKVTVD